MSPGSAFRPPLLLSLHKVPGKGLVRGLAGVNSDYVAAVEGRGALPSSAQPLQAVVLAPLLPPLSLTIHPAPALAQH